MRSRRNSTTTSDKAVILVVCAAAAELRGFSRAGVDVVAVGVGPVEAALGTLRALAVRPYRLTINAGIAGAFAGHAQVGDAVAVTAETYVDLGREDRVALQLPDGLALTATCAADRELLDRFRRTEPAIHFGPGLTSATITTSAARAATLAARHAAATESMEGFAVLRAATAAGVAAIELRGISNIVGDRAQSQWDFRAGADATVRALDAFLDVVKGTA
jgi:futalosine hydrolase